MKHEKLIKKLEEAAGWRDVVPGLLITESERNLLLKLLRKVGARPQGN
jgi:hypothetical protein